MYLVSELIKSFFPSPIDGKIYLARQKLGGKKVYSYRAAVVEQHEGQKTTIHVETKLANSRGEALDKLLEILEDIAEEKLSEAAEEGIDEAAKAIEEAGKRNVEIQDAVPEAASKKGAKKRDPSRTAKEGAVKRWQEEKDQGWAEVSGVA
jgi:hypothetical protein